MSETEILEYAVTLGLIEGYSVHPNGNVKLTMSSKVIDVGDICTVTVKLMELFPGLRNVSEVQDRVFRPNLVGYCPWCGGEISVESFVTRPKVRVFWSPCRAMFPCTGAMANVITDEHGFILAPQSMHSRYVYSRRLPDNTWHGYNARRNDDQKNHT